MPYDEKVDNNFCQEPSDWLLDLIEEAGDDPRSAYGEAAIKDLEKTNGWTPCLDARDARKTVPAQPKSKG